MLMMDAGGCQLELGEKAQSVGTAGASLRTIRKERSCVNAAIANTRRVQEITVERREVRDKYY